MIRQARQSASEPGFGGLLCSLETLRVLRSRFVWQSEGVRTLQNTAERILFLTAFSSVTVTAASSSSSSPTPLDESPSGNPRSEEGSPSDEPDPSWSPSMVFLLLLRGHLRLCVSKLTFERNRCSRRLSRPAWLVAFWSSGRLFGGAVQRDRHDARLIFRLWRP